jgi:YidC/Oxa1 family membrane protein insertase
MKNNNESPFGNPRFLLVLLVTFISLWGWQYYMNAKYPAAVKTETAATQPAKEAPTETTAVTPTDVNKVAVQASAGKPADYQEQKYTYSDENVKFTITSEGFGFSEFLLNDYKNADKQFISFTKEFSIYNLQYKGKNILFKITPSEDLLTYTGLAQVGNFQVTRTLVYNKTNRSFQSTISFPEGLEEIVLNVNQAQLIPKSTNFLMPSFDHQDFVNVSNGKTVSERISGHNENDIFIKNYENVKMASIGSQYFVTSIVNNSDILPVVNNKIEKQVASLNFEYKIAGTKTTELKQTFYIGPKKTEILQTIDSSLPEVLNYGIFGFISKFLLLAMKYIHSFVGNWGIAIIILTLIVRGLLLPFNIMSFRSAQAMQKIKPKMDEVREKYKSDPMRLNKETMALMKQNNANPLSGCLPMLLQIPVFFAFFATISTSIELYHQPFFGWITDLSSYDHFFVLPILMGITMYFQQKLTPTTMDPLQAKILNFMPIIFTLFMVTLPSGLTLYNFISALFGVVQQYFLLKDTKEKDALITVKANK